MFECTPSRFPGCPACEPNFLTCSYSHFLAILIEIFGFTAEAALMVWLLVKGVEEQKWG
jgi:hypothetical protein